MDRGGERRSNAPHPSTTDPDAQRVRKSQGQPAILGSRGHVLMENRHGLVVGAQATQCVGASEHATAIPGERRATLGGDTGNATEDVVAGCRALTITSPVAQHSTVAPGTP